MWRYIFRHRIILKKVTFNVTILVTVFKSDGKCNDKCDDSIFLKTVSYSIMRYGTVRYGTVRTRYGDASGINSIEILYLGKLCDHKQNSFWIFILFSIECIISFE